MITTASNWRAFSSNSDLTLDPFLALVVPEVDRIIRTELNNIQIEQRSGIVEYQDGNGSEIIITRYAPVQVLTEVREDQTGYWGTNANAFGTGTIKTSGVDYALIPDDPITGWSKVGRIQRLNALWPSRPIVPPGRLSSKLVNGLGAIKLTYTAGLTDTPTTVPLDLQLAGNLLISQIKLSRIYGFLMTSEGLAEYHYSLGQLIHGFLQIGSVAAILAKYKELPV